MLPPELPHDTDLQVCIDDAMDVRAVLMDTD
jgi:hypothetical protein